MQKKNYFFLISEQGLTIFDFRSMRILINQKSLILVLKSILYLRLFLTKYSNLLSSDTWGHAPLSEYLKLKFVI